MTVLEADSTDGAETLVALDSDILLAFGSAEISPSAEARIVQLVADVAQETAVSVTGGPNAEPEGREASRPSGDPLHR